MPTEKKIPVTWDDRPFTLTDAGHEVATLRTACQTALDHLNALQNSNPDRTTGKVVEVLKKALGLPVLHFCPICDKETDAEPDAYGHYYCLSCLTATEGEAQP